MALICWGADYAHLFGLGIPLADSARTVQPVLNIPKEWLLFVPPLNALSRTRYKEVVTQFSTGVRTDTLNMTLFPRDTRRSGEEICASERG